MSSYTTSESTSESLLPLASAPYRVGPQQGTQPPVVDLHEEVGSQVHPFGDALHLSRVVLWMACEAGMASCSGGGVFRRSIPQVEQEIQGAREDIREAMSDANAAGSDQPFGGWRLSYGWDCTDCVVVQYILAA